MCGKLAMPEDGMVFCNQHKRKPKQQASSFLLPAVSGPLIKTANEPSLDLSGLQYFAISNYTYLYESSCFTFVKLHKILKLALRLIAAI